FGCTRKTLGAAVSSGRIARLRSGVFASFDAPADAVTAARHGGALTCAAALRLHGVWVLDDDPAPHVWMSVGGRTHAHPMCRCVTHYRPGTPALGIAPVERALVHAYG